MDGPKCVFVVRTRYRYLVRRYKQGQHTILPVLLLRLLLRTRTTTTSTSTTTTTTSTATTATTATVNQENMSSRWHEKKARQAEIAFEKALQNTKESSLDVSSLIKDVAMGGGDEKIFEKKLSKEEKKAQAKARREAKKKKSGQSGGDDNDDDDDDDDNNKAKISAAQVLEKTKEAIHQADQPAAANDGIDHDAADALAAAGTICTFSASRKGVDARARDINVTNFTLQHMGAVLLDETEIVLNHGNRYGLIGRNGCGKSTLLKALGARAIPIPNSIDIFFLKEEIEPSDTVTALEAVMSVDEERSRLELQADELNHLLATMTDSPPEQEEGEDKTQEEIQEEIMDALNLVYERLDALDAATAEVRARSILSGLGFTHEMQSKKTKDFSGGWRMRVSLARALFIQPVWYVSQYALCGLEKSMTISCTVSISVFCWTNLPITWVSIVSFGGGGGRRKDIPAPSRTHPDDS